MCSNGPSFYTGVILIIVWWVPVMTQDSSTVECPSPQILLETILWNKSQQKNQLERKKMGRLSLRRYRSPKSFLSLFFFFIWKKKMDQLLLVNGVGTHKKPMAQYFSLLEHHNWRELLDLWSTYNYRANSNQDRFKPSIIILNEKGIPSSIKERRFSLGIIPKDIFTLFFVPLAGKRSPHKWRRVTYLEIDPYVAKWQSRMPTT